MGTDDWGVMGTAIYGAVGTVDWGLRGLLNGELWGLLIGEFLGLLRCVKPRTHNIRYMWCCSTLHDMQFTILVTARSSRQHKTDERSVQ
jgi:hypothetical protein